MRILTASVLTATLTLTGCFSSTTITVVDADSKPVPNAKVDYFKLPRRHTDPWSTTPAETKAADAAGTVTFDHNSGRFVARTDQGVASFSSTFAPQKMELGIGN